jgi:acyl-lipid omega-6 desaturase (Delta-12 desaturase)
MLVASLRLVLFVAIHAALSTLGFAADHLLVWVAVWALQSVNFLTLVGVIHESVHQHFFPTRRASRVAGMLAGAVAFTCFEAYRTQHILHHAHTCDEGDSEGEPYKFTARWQIVGAFLGGGLIYAVALFFGGIGVAFGWTPSWITKPSQRRRIRVNVAVLAVVLTALIASIATGLVTFQAVAYVWLIPTAFALLGPLPFVLIPEHYDAPGPGPTVSNTRTCVSNPVMRFVFLNTNLHTAHHDRPSVPWHALGTHHQKIEADIHDEWIFPSYTAFYVWMWRTTSRPPAHTAAAA